MSETTMPPIGAEPVGWETDREWELEQRAFHCNEDWTFADIRQLINDLWFQYCLAANPVNIDNAVAAKDAEIKRLRDALEPFALIVSEGLAKPRDGYVSVISCASYFERAREVFDGGSDAPST